MQFEKAELLDMHRFSATNRLALEQAQSCGCFYCLTIFDPAEIAEWVDVDKTAICPHCGIDSIIPSSVSPNFGSELLRSMKQVWF